MSLDVYLLVCLPFHCYFMTVGLETCLLSSIKHVHFYFGYDLVYDKSYVFLVSIWIIIHFHFIFFMSLQLEMILKCCISCCIHAYLCLPVSRRFNWLIRFRLFCLTY